MVTDINVYLRPKNMLQSVAAQVSVYSRHSNGSDEVFYLWVDKGSTEDSQVSVLQS